MCFNLGESANLEQNEPYSTWKTMISRKCSFQKLPVLLHRNNVVDAAASNIDGFLCSDACVV
jgi:hypothetical protein